MTVSVNERQGQLAGPTFTTFTNNVAMFTATATTEVIASCRATTGQRGVGERREGDERRGAWLRNQKRAEGEA
jgi:hypothetical protein